MLPVIRGESAEQDLEARAVADPEDEIGMSVAVDVGRDDVVGHRDRGVVDAWS